MNKCCELSFFGKFCTEDGTTVLGFVHFVNGVPIYQFFNLSDGLPYTGIVYFPDACADPLTGFLKVDAELSTTLQPVKDNEDNVSALNLATDKISVTGDAAISGNITAANLASGSYLPTLSSVLNVTSTGAQNLTYLRVGNTVTIAGQLDLKAAGAGLAVVGISLPIASNFANVFQAGGVGVALTGTSSLSASIQANASSNEVEIRVMATDTTTRTFTFSCTYQVI